MYGNELLTFIRNGNHVMISGDWSDVRFLAFDAPLMFKDSYKKRHSFLQQSISADNPIVKVADHVTVQSTEQVEEMTKEAQSVILRNASSKYEEPNSLFKCTV